MAEFEVHKDPVRGFTHFAVKGEVLLDETLACMSRYYARDAASIPLALWDFRLADLSSFYSAELESTILMIEKNIEMRQGGKSALLVDSDVGFGLARMLETNWELTDLPMEMRAFRKYDEAVAWLGLSDT